MPREKWRLIVAWKPLRLSSHTSMAESANKQAGITRVNFGEKRWRCWEIIVRTGPFQRLGLATAQRPPV